MLVSMLVAPLLFLASYVAAQEGQIILQKHESFTPSTLRVGIIGKLLHLERPSNKTIWHQHYTKRIWQVPEQRAHLLHTTFAITRIPIPKLLRRPSTLPYLRPHPVSAAAPQQSTLLTTHAILPSLEQASSSKSTTSYTTLRNNSI